MTEYKIVGIRKVANSGYCELSLYTISDVDHSVRCATALVKTEKVSNYRIGEYVICRNRKFGEKWYFFPAKCSMAKPSLEVFTDCGINELPF